MVLILNTNLELPEKWKTAAMLVYKEINSFYCDLGKWRVVLTTLRVRVELDTATKLKTAVAYL